MITSVQLEEVLYEFRGLCEGLTETQLNWRPAADAWSIAECLDHLTVTATTFRTAIEAGIAESPRPVRHRADPAIQPPWWGRWFLRILEPPVVRFKIKAPPNFQPRAANDGDVALTNFIETHTALLRKWPDWMEADLRGTKVRGVFPVPFPLILVMHVIPTHMRRHLWQAKRVASAAGFPTAKEAAHKIADRS